MIELSDIENIGEPVILNIYDMHKINNCLWKIGLGIYHSGVEIYGKEYSYNSNNGIFYIKPKSIKGQLRTQILLGKTFKSQIEIEEILNILKEEFTPEKYNNKSNNSNYFSNKFVGKILNKNIPKYLLRNPYFGSLCCIIPPEFDYENEKILG